jgi:chromodomain-helicase-DNA-binding protein 4
VYLYQKHKFAEHSSLHIAKVSWSILTDKAHQIALSELFDLPNGTSALHEFRKMNGFQDESNPLSFSHHGQILQKKRKRDEGDQDDYIESDSEEPMDRPVDKIEDTRYFDEECAREAEESDDFDLFPAKRNARTNRHSRRQVTRRFSPDDTGESESSHPRAQTQGRNLRSRISRNRSAKNVPLDRQDDEDELAADRAPDVPPVQSDVVTQKNKSRRRRPQRTRVNHQAKNNGFREASIEFEVRRSSRANKNSKTMMEDVDMDEDSFYVEDGKGPTAPKVISVKEVFKPLETPKEAAFKNSHCKVCDTCNQDGPRAAQRGQLIHCQGCSLSFHKVCLGIRSQRDHLVTKVGPEHFVLQCRYCVGVYRAKDHQVTRHDMCQSCHGVGPACAAFAPKKTAKQEERARLENGGEDPIHTVDPGLINNEANVLFRCSSCRRGYHFEHLPQPSGSSSSVEEVDIAMVRAEQLAEYSIDWKCKDCRDMTLKVGGLVAWRPTGPYQPGQNFADFNDDNKEYLVKWEKKSHAHCEWKSGAWVWGVVHAAMRRAFKQNEPLFTAEEAIPEEYLLADVILAVRYRHPSAAGKTKKDDMDRITDVTQIMVKFQGLAYDQVVWDSPPPPQRDSKRWIAFEAAYYEFLNGKYFDDEPYNIIHGRIDEYRSAPEFPPIESQPAGLRQGCALMKYQIQGLSWLLLKYYRGESVVLADEMGLGKTIQVVAFLTHLVQNSPRCWPFLVVVPNSTCPNWRREIKNWSPDLRVVTYHGGKVAQDLAYQYELFPKIGKNVMKAHVVVMSYDSAQDDETKRLFKSVRWAGLVVDEGQRLKNEGNILYKALQGMKIDFRLLLTGTPLQNNKRELFNLLQFIDESRNAAQLDLEFGELTADNIPKLHELIRPYFLRRTKAAVLKFLPPMAQIIVPVTMSVVQEKLCKSIMSKNPELIRAIFAKDKLKATERGSLNNILMQLRKCLCHPFVYSEAIEERAIDSEALHRNLIQASSKLVLLNLMLPKLKERGHRVLIFSQFLAQLDIMEDFLIGMGYQYQRLDGNMSSLEKQKRIDSFNAKDSALFAFLLSTRAGGVGINLATADTVIILDPDFNPHQDIQAISRAHRIGQKKKVLCFQFMTKNSVEEKIMQIGRKKMALDHALIESMDLEDDAENDLESILKHGAMALLDDDAAKHHITYDSASVDKLLDRSQVENTNTDNEKSAESQFSLARVWANDKGTLADDLVVTEAPEAAALSVWDNIIRQREEAARRKAEEEKEVLGRGGRRRQVGNQVHCMGFRAANYSCSCRR